MREKGFTFIEILIVILIISVMSGVAVVTLTPNYNKEAERTVFKIYNLLHLAAEEALLKPATLGLSFADNHYQFYLYHPVLKSSESNFIPFTSKIFKRYALPKNIFVEIKPHKLASATPQIIINENGDFNNFKILVGISKHKPRYQIIGKSNGELKYELLNY